LVAKVERLEKALDGAVNVSAGRVEDGTPPEDANSPTVPMRKSVAPADLQPSVAVQQQQTFRDIVKQILFVGGQEPLMRP
jgi:hypothetical protein